MAAPAAFRVHRTGSSPGRVLARVSSALVARAVVLFVLVSLAPVGAQTAQELLDPPAAAWPQHGRVVEAWRFSPLAQIDRENVSGLRLVWSHELGFVGSYRSAAAVWDARLFVAVPGGVRALDAATGEVLWSYQDPEAAEASARRSGQPRGSPLVVGGTVIVSLRVPVVMAFDSADGRVLWRSSLSEYGFAEGVPAHPIFAGGPIVVGTMAESRGPLAGRLVALDPTDGSVVWSWSALPTSPSDEGHATWQPMSPGRQSGIGGAGILNVGAYDPQSDTVLFGTSTAAPWDRLDVRRRNDGPASADLFISSFVALSAADGALEWFHQVVPGDEWEYDQRSVPMFVDLDVGGAARRVALLSTSTGYLVTLDGATGDFLAGQRMVPESNVHLGYGPGGDALIDDAMRDLGEREPTRVCPGPRWVNFAPAAYSPRTGLLYLPNDTACIQRGTRSTDAPRFEAMWLQAEPRHQGDYYERFGALSAIDPVTADVVWAFETPYPHDAGALVTAGDLVFSSFADRMIRAFDARTGEVLWESLLSAHSDASPISYEVDGVQYVAVAAGHETGVSGIPDRGVPRSVAGAATLFVFALPR